MDLNRRLEIGLARFSALEADCVADPTLQTGVWRDLLREMAKVGQTVLVGRWEGPAFGNSAMNGYL